MTLRMGQRTESGGGLVDSLIGQFQAQQAQANAANEARFQQGLEIFDRIIAQNQPGGALEQATEAGLERGRKKSVAQGTQALVSAGLSGTTTAAGLGRAYEEEVGAPARLRAADISAQRLTEARLGKVGFIERREDVGPDFGTIAQLAQGIGAGQARRVSSRSSGPATPAFPKAAAYAPSTGTGGGGDAAYRANLAAIERIRGGGGLTGGSKAGYKPEIKGFRSGILR